MANSCDYEKDQLQVLLQDESRLNAMVDSMPQVTSLPNDKELKLAQSKSLAEYNLSIEPQLKKALAHLRDTHANVAEVKEEVNVMKSKLDSVAETRSLDSVCSSLKNLAQSADDESETISDHFYKGSVEIDDFVKKFTEKRVMFHTRRLKSEKLAELLRQQSNYQQQHLPAFVAGMTAPLSYTGHGRLRVGCGNVATNRHYPTLRESANAPYPEDLYEPRFESERKYPDVALINVLLQAHDYQPVEKFQSYVHWAAKQFEFRVIESYGLAHTAELVKEFKAGSSDRSSHAPVGMKINVKKHCPRDEQCRYIPDPQLEDFKETLRNLDDPVVRKLLGWEA
uniref:VPS37 C-terminal domain-containing protein n=1 Tax=Globodera rostochiensis TaxID=31243 RepID=A0A914GTK6_GLORO